MMNQKNTMLRKKCFVTGGAGFIGSNLVDALLKQGHEVTVYDNLSTGNLEFLWDASTHKHFRFIEADLHDLQSLNAGMQGSDIVFHLAANADVRFGPDHPRRDLEQNTIATHNVLEAMRLQQVRQIVFSSTGSVYGEADVIPTPEDAPFPIQTSLYGASKLASEALITAYSEAFNIQSFIYRFVSILGERYTHGHVYDFYAKLQKNPQQLHILGNGTQRKSYLYVQDCIDAILLSLEISEQKINVFNLGTDEYCTVNDSATWIAEYLNLRPEFTYSGGDRGWIGDNPFIYLDCSKIRALGWNPKYTIKESVVKTVQYLQTNDWVFERQK